MGQVATRCMFYNGAGNKVLCTGTRARFFPLLEMKRSEEKHVGIWAGLFNSLDGATSALPAAAGSRCGEKQLPPSDTLSRNQAPRRSLNPYYSAVNWGHVTDSPPLQRRASRPVQRAQSVADGGTYADLSTRAVQTVLFFHFRETTNKFRKEDDPPGATRSSPTRKRNTNSEHEDSSTRCSEVLLLEDTLLSTMIQCYFQHKTPDCFTKIYMLLHSRCCN